MAQFLHDKFAAFNFWMELFLELQFDITKY